MSTVPLEFPSKSIKDGYALVNQLQVFLASTGFWLQPPEISAVPDGALVKTAVVEIPWEPSSGQYKAILRTPDEVRDMVGKLLHNPRQKGQKQVAKAWNDHGTGTGLTVDGEQVDAPPPPPSASSGPSQLAPQSIDKRVEIHAVDLYRAAFIVKIGNRLVRIRLPQKYGEKLKTIYSNLPAKLLPKSVGQGDYVTNDDDALNAITEIRKMLETCT